jgi:ribosomal protein S18 acetylase RimI-like enzyme
MLTVNDADFRLRASDFDEVDDLFAIHCAASRPYVEQTWGWDEDWQRQYFRDHFKPSLRQVIVCQGTPVGFVDVTRTAGRLDLINIEIVPAFQGRRIGTRIIRELIAESERSGVPVHLQVLRKNTRAEALYRRLGFVEESQTATHTRMIRSPRGSPTGR